MYLQKPILFLLLSLIQLSSGFPNLISACLGNASVGSNQEAHPSFYLQCTFWFCLSSVKLLLIHAALLPYLCVFLHPRIAHSNSDEVVLEDQPAALGPFVLQCRVLLDPAKKISEQAKVSSPQVQVCDSICLFHFFQNFKL